MSPLSLMDMHPSCSVGGLFASDELSSLIRILPVVYCGRCSVITVIRTPSQASYPLTVNIWRGGCLLEPVVLIVAKFNPIILHRQAAEALIK